MNIRRVNTFALGMRLVFVTLPEYGVSHIAYVSVPVTGFFLLLDKPYINGIMSRYSLNYMGLILAEAIRTFSRFAECPI